MKNACKICTQNKQTDHFPKFLLNQSKLSKEKFQISFELLVIQPDEILKLNFISIIKHPEDKVSTRQQEISLINNSYFSAIHYHIHLDMKFY